MNDIEPPPGTAATDAPLPRPLRRSAWTTKQKIVRLFWMSAGRAMWVMLPSMRSSTLRMFGGRVGKKCKFARNVAIAIPWNVHIGNNVEVGQHVILYSLGVITIGDDCVLDDFAHLCAGTHDMTDSRFPLLTPPITIGNACFVGIDAYVGPNVTLGDNCNVWPRASVHANAPGNSELKGNPAKPVPKTQAPATSPGSTTSVAEEPK